MGVIEFLTVVNFILAFGIGVMFVQARKLFIHCSDILDSHSMYMNNVHSVLVEGIEKESLSKGR